MNKDVSVILTTGAILAVAIGTGKSNAYELAAWAGVAFAGSLVGYAVGFRRDMDLTYASVLGALAGGLGVPLLVVLVVVALNYAGVL